MPRNLCLSKQWKLKILVSHPIPPAEEMVMGKGFTLNQGMLFLTTEAPGGLYNSLQLQKIASVVEEEAAIVKVTEDQRLALIVSPGKTQKIAKELLSVGIGLRHYQEGLHQPVSCVGRYCPAAQQDALGLAIDLSEHLKGIALESQLRIGINGCSRGCVPIHTLDIAITGDSSGYRISLGGKSEQIPEMSTFMAEGVPAAKLPKMIEKVIKAYKDLAQKDETLQQTIERAGAAQWIAALAPYSQDASAEADNPFGDLDHKIDGFAGPAVEVESEDRSVLREPSVEAFSEEPIDDLSHEIEPMEAVEDLPVAESDEALPSESSDVAMPKDQEFNDDISLDGASPISDQENDIKLEEFEAEILEDEEILGSQGVKETEEASSDEAVSASFDDVDEESVFEEQLNASLEEEASIPAAHDHYAESSQEAMRIVEAANIVHEELISEGDEESSEVHPTLEEPAPSIPHTTKAAASAESAAFELVAMELTPIGKLSLRFSTGAALLFDPKMVQHGKVRELTVSGKKVSLSSTPEGICVDVDGVCLILPLAAA